MDYNARHDACLEKIGLRVFRTTDYDVLQQVGIVLEDLRKFIVVNYGHKGA